MDNKAQDELAGMLTALTVDGELYMVDYYMWQDAFDEEGELLPDEALNLYCQKSDPAELQPQVIFSMNSLIEANATFFKLAEIDINHDLKAQSAPKLT